MKNNILYLVAMWALLACVPAPVQDRPSGGTLSDDFTIAPEGTWLPNCLDVADGTKTQGLVAHQLQAVFASQEPTFTLSRSFLSQNCKENKPAVALYRQTQGKIVLGAHSDIDEDRRGRVVEVEVSSESYTPKSDIGLTYLKLVINNELHGQLAVDKEFVVPADHMPYSKLHGMLVVKKNVRNAMHIYLAPDKKDAKDILPHLNPSNLYMHYITK